MQHLTHEEALAPPDTHHWRDELGVPEKKVQKEKLSIRLQNTWESMTSTQKSLIGLGILALVVALFFSNMLFNMFVQGKYDKIQEGMTIEEVESIMGGPGRKVERAPDHPGVKDSGPVKPETRIWEVSDKNFVITFSNGKVAMKQIQEK
jgi:hypothetical protein